MRMFGVSVREERQPLFDTGLDGFETDDYLDWSRTGKV